MSTCLEHSCVYAFRIMHQRKRQLVQLSAMHRVHTVQWCVNECNDDVELISGTCEESVACEKTTKKG